MDKKQKTPENAGQQNSFKNGSDNQLQKSTPSLILEPFPAVIITDYSGQTTHLLTARVAGNTNQPYKFILENLSGGELIHKDKIFSLHFKGRSTGFNVISWKLNLDPYVYTIGEVFTHSLRIRASSVDDNHSLEHRFSLTTGRGGIQLINKKKAYIYHTNPETSNIKLKFLAVKENVCELIINQDPFTQNQVILLPEKNKIKANAANKSTAFLADNLGFTLVPDLHNPFNLKKMTVTCWLKNTREFLAAKPIPNNTFEHVNLIIQLNQPDSAAVLSQIDRISLQLTPVAEHKPTGSLKREIEYTVFLITRHCPLHLQGRWLQMLIHLRENKDFPADDVFRLRSILHRTACYMQQHLNRSWQAEQEWAKELANQILADEDIYALYLKALFAAYLSGIPTPDNLTRFLRKFFCRYVSAFLKEVRPDDFLYHEKENITAAVALLTTGNKTSLTARLPEGDYPGVKPDLRIFIWIIYTFFRFLRATTSSEIHNKTLFEEELWSSLVGALIESSVKIETGFRIAVDAAELEQIGAFIFPELKWQENRELLMQLLHRFWDRIPAATEG